MEKVNENKNVSDEKDMEFENWRLQAKNFPLMKIVLKILLKDLKKCNANETGLINRMMPRKISAFEKEASFPLQIKNLQHLKSLM